VGIGVVLGVSVLVGVPGRGVLVRVGRGVLVRCTGGRGVGGIGVMVTMGVIGLSVGDGEGVGVTEGVRVGDRVGLGVQVLVGGGGTVGVGSTSV
jgi:hypothetical protein